MSGRRRRFESLWDAKEVDVPPAEISGNIPLLGKETSPKWSNSEANDVVMSDDITGQFSWDPLQGNGNMPKDDDIGKDNRRTQTDPDFDEPRNQSSARPSDDSHGMLYRGRDRGVGGTGNVNRDRGRSRSRSPKRSSRGNTRGMARSRSRSRSRSRGRDRGRAWENSGGSRHEGNRNSTEVSRNRFPDDYDRGDRNAYDDQDRKRQSRRNSGVPCRFFAIGKCSRNDCKFSHDVPETGGYDGRSHDPDFDDKNKSWNGPSWGDVDSRGFEERSGDDFHGQTLDDKIRTRDHPPPRDTSGSSAIAKSKHNSDENKPRDGVNASDFSKDPKSNKNIDRKRKSWDEVGVSDMKGKGITDVQKPQLIADRSRVPSNLNETKQTQLFNGSVLNNEGGRPVKASETGVPQVTNAMNSQQVSSLPTSLPPGQLPQAYTELNIANALGLLYSLPVSTSSGPMAVQQNLDIRSKEQYESARNTEVKGTVPMDNSADPNSRKLGETGGLVEEHGKSSKSKKQERVGNAEGNESRLGENPKRKPENINPGNSEAQGKAEEVNMSSDEKAMRLFKIALVDFVKEILKPTWKEGKMSREVHKTIVKKVVDKVTSTIQGVQIPRTQERIDHYLAFSKSKITKLIEAYVERSLKA